LSRVDFDAIKARIGISDILNRYIEVPNREQFRCRCPVHMGDGANLYVNDAKGFAFCHSGCHRGYDAISLFAAVEGISNYEAGLKLAAEYSIDVQLKPSIDIKKYEKVVHQIPEELPETIPLDEHRGFSKEAIEHFGLRRVPGDGFGSGVANPNEDSSWNSCRLCDKT